MELWYVGAVKCYQNSQLILLKLSTRKCGSFPADMIDSTFWDHLFRKRPAARSDDLANNECGNFIFLRFLIEKLIYFKLIHVVSVWTDMNNTCSCRAEELHCQHRHLRRLPGDLPDDGISLL